MSFKYFINRERLVLRIILAISLFMWGFQKITTPAMDGVYVKDFQQLIFLDPRLFLIIAGSCQIILAVGMIAGIYTRYIAAIYVFMGLITFIVPGFFTIGNPYKFTYGLVMAGAGLSLVLTGAGFPSWDSRQLRKERLEEVEE